MGSNCTLVANKGIVMQIGCCWFWDYTSGGTRDKNCTIQNISRWATDCKKNKFHITMKSTLVILLLIVVAASSAFPQYFARDLGDDQGPYFADAECQDNSYMCLYYIHFCENTSSQNYWVQQNCRKTCKKCWTKGRTVHWRFVSLLLVHAM